MISALRQATASNGVRLAPLLLLFFLSGASALVYQVLWMRLLALVFGVTIHAASTVLAAFMTGLALGSAAAGRLADRLQRPLRAFAAAEVLIALAALATPLALTSVETVYVRLHEVLGGVPVLVGLVRLLLSFLVLIVPATLMGATLPLVLKSALGRESLVGRQVSLLYAVNTAGAIAGVLIAGIWMVPQLGITWAFRIAAFANLAVAAGAFLLSRMAAPRAVATTGPVTADATVHQRWHAEDSDAVRRLVFLTYVVSGFVSFALEIVWFRVLIVLFRPTTYAFTVMLATMLAGIAAGSWLCTPLVSRRRFNSLAALAVLELLIAIAAAGSMAVIGRAGAVYAWAAPMFAEGRLAYFGPMAVTSIAAILPVAVLMGMAFPLGVSIWVGDAASTRAGERVGSIYAGNVAGAVAGSLVTAFALLPSVGSRTSLVLVATLSLAMGLLLLSRLRSRAVALVTATLALAGFAAIVWSTPDPVAGLLKTRYPAETPVWAREDGHASVTILRRDSRFAAQPVQKLYINGMHQASDEPGMVAYHRMIGTLAVAVHSEPQRALVIGAGGGATAGAVGAFNNSLSVDVVELSRAVVEAAGLFSGINQRLLQRPNVQMHVDDGRNFMLLTDRKYDVVTADVILPVHAGAGNLYSVEYYRLVRRVLQNRGIAVQWIGSGTETEYKLIMRTFLTVFPHTTLWQGGSLMVGATRPLVMERAAFLRKQQTPESKAAMDAMGFTSFEALLSRYNGGPAELRAFVGDGPILTDDRPLTEYFLALPQDDAPVDLSTIRGDVRRHVVPAAATVSPSGS